MTYPSSPSQPPRRRDACRLNGPKDTLYSDTRVTPYTATPTTFQGSPPTPASVLRHIVDGDPASHRLMEGILAVEDERADELSEFLLALPEDAERGTRPGSTS